MYTKRIIKYSIIEVIVLIIVIYAPTIYTVILAIMQVGPSYKELDMNIEKYNIKQGYGNSSFTTTNIAD
ncbi:MAG: hypothetical protein KatS3mg003_2385 [Candidatus Nitrosocaldaceae archaeon]|nr:MAG: hypothetical protein KatS3mg003_2385 [Candidatus Nitrosocaldaceae archaeon]